ncbi:MAG TPA: VWA domain-containing protein [Vicinamibacteria bacterium]|nr:VWA domain-containing protein [Vicinamibacteria bacterium]
MRPIAAITAGLVLAVAAGPAAPQQVVPGARAEVVQLDAVVTDARGALVRDLTQDDFQILEDGKPHRVSQFFVVTRSRPAPVATPAPSDPGVVVEAPSVVTPPAVDSAAAPGRQVVILVDDLHIGLQSMVEAKRSLRRFLDEVASPDDAIAVVTTSGAGPIQQLTRDRAIVGQALERLVTREPSSATNRSARLTPDQAALVLRGDRTALQLAIETVISEPGTLLDANSPQVAVEGGPGAQSAQGAAAAAAGAAGTTRDAVEKVAQREVERQATQLLNEALRYSLATLNILEDVVRSFARMPGRKLCLVVSDGFLDGSGSRESRSLDLRRVLDAATRSGTVVYALDSRGLLTGADASVASVGASPGVQARVERAAEQIKRDTLTTLADGTGGFLVRGTNDLVAGLRRMLDDNEAYYLLAYEPTNTRRDGRFRKIEVRLPGRPDLKVRTRSGYYAPDASKPAAPTRAAAPAAPAPSFSVPAAEARAVLSAPIDAGGIPVALRADYVDLPPAGSQVLVRAQVDLAKMRWQEAEGRHRADVELLGGVFDSAGQPVGAPFGRRAELALDPKEYERALTAGLQYQQRLALPPGRYEVRLVARERGLVQQGGASQSVDVPDLKEKKLAMSGLFLSAAPAGGAAPVETVGHRFKRGDSLSFQFYVYNPAVDADGHSDVVLQAQVWSGGKATAASPVQPVRLQQKDGVPVPETNVMGLEGLPAGSYELRVVVQDRKGSATTFRRVPFTID